MSQLGIVWRKEMLEAWRNRKWIWLPIVFVLLGVMEPISTHFMPQILKLSGGLPPGTVIHIPTPSAGEVFTKAQSQYSTLGLLVLVLAFMGSVSNERQYGVLELVLVKRVSHASYILAKWLAASCLTFISLLIGDLFAWYYTVQLIGPLSLGHVLSSAVFYTVWLLLIITLTLFFSVLLQSSIANAFISLVTAAVLSVLSDVLKWSWSPGSLPSQAGDLAMQGSTSPGAVSGVRALLGATQTGAQGDLVWSITIAIALVGCLLAAAIVVFPRRVSR